ncbi:MULTISPECIES: hypothetical protein [unclassified Bradyrhizobium]
MMSRRNDPQHHALWVRTTGKSQGLRIFDSVIVLITTLSAAAKALRRVSQ